MNLDPGTPFWSQAWRPFNVCRPLAVGEWQVEEHVFGPFVTIRGAVRPGILVSFKTTTFPATKRAPILLEKSG